MAAALLALAKPVYAGIDSTKRWMTKHPEEVGEAFSAQRIKSIPLGFGQFAKGFIGGGGTDRLAGMVGKKRDGGIIHTGADPHHEIPTDARTYRPHHGRPRDGGSIVAGMSHGSSHVLGHIPHAGFEREIRRRQADFARPVVG